MARSVLGNDPFQRGAADRQGPEAATPAPEARAAGKKKAPAQRTPKAGRAKPAGANPPAAKSTARKAAAAKPAAPKPAAKKPRAAKRPAPASPRPTDTLATGSQEALTDAQLTAAQALVELPPVTEMVDPEPPAPALLRPPPPAPGDAAPGADEPSAAQRLEPRHTEPALPRATSLAVAQAASPHEPQARRVEQRGDLAERASGALRLARDMAVQALASEGMGKAVGVAQGLFGALRAGLGTGGSTALDLYGKDAGLVEELRPVLDFLYERYWRVSVQGAELIPEGPAILVANHSGALPFDGPVMQLALGRERPDLAEARWLAEDQVFHAPMLGTLFNRLGAVRACQENAERLLDERRPVVVFPEGIQGLSKPFAQRYQLKRFGRGGFVKLALRTGAPIVPVAIVGAEESSPLLARLPGQLLGLPYLPLTPLGPLPLPAKWSIRFGAPLDLGGLGPEAAGDLSEVQRLTERTRESIQGMLQALLLQRRSVFSG